MKSSPDIDQELLEMLREAGPQAGSGAAAGLDTEEALRLLIAQIHASSTRSRPPRRPRYVLRTGALALGVAAGAFVAINVTSSGQGGPVSAARAATIVEKARAALLYRPGSILEDDEISSGGGEPTEELHGWTSTTAPYNERIIWTVSGRKSWEEEITGNRSNLYDPTTNTIYDQAPPSYDLRPGTSPGTELLTVPKAAHPGGCPGPLPPADHGTVTLTLSTAQAHGIRDGSDIIDYSHKQTQTIVTNPEWNPASPATGLSPNIHSPVQEALYLLHRPGVRVNPDATLDGSPAIEITSAAGDFTYWVSPGTYRPLLLSNAAGTWTRRFPIYRLLSGADATPALLSLTAQHPTARVDTNGDDYAKAACRLS